MAAFACDTFYLCIRKISNYCFAEKPRDYLITLLERLRIAKETGIAFPFFMDNSNIVAMFEMMDSAGRGAISFVQYKEGQYLLQVELTVCGWSTCHHYKIPRCTSWGSL